MYWCKAYTDAISTVNESIKWMRKLIPEAFIECWGDFLINQKAIIAEKVATPQIPIPATYKTVFVWLLSVLVSGCFCPLITVCKASSLEIPFYSHARSHIIVGLP